ncbi:MAG: ABC transporter permease [Sedimentisphaerales bacterium]|nr:ABC transporter permease [Sedimentisphaerales bacterium]
MQKILKVAQREYIETVRTKVFLLSILALPVMIVAIIFFAHRLSQTKAAPRPAVKVAFTDISNELSAQIKISFDKYNESHPERQILPQELENRQSPETAQRQGKDNLRSGKLDAYVVLDEDILQGLGKMYFYTHKPKPTKIDMLWTIENLFREAVINQRYELQELDRQMLDKLQFVPTERVEVGSADQDERIQKQSDRIVRMMVPFFFMYLLFLGIIGTGQQMLSSVIEEKGSRVIEVLLSAVSPFELMAGKILGLVGIGMTVICLWGVAAYLTGRWQGLNVDVPPGILPYFTIYYILGFLLFSSIMVGIGSICNTIKETQSLMTPVILLCVVPIIAWQNIIQHPGGTLARVLSFIPPTTPMVMILRLSAGGDIPLAEVFASIVVLAAAALAMIWLAAKVFRTGILIYGKRPGLREVLRWLRQA